MDFDISICRYEENADEKNSNFFLIGVIQTCGVGVSTSSDGDVGSGADGSDKIMGIVVTYAVGV